MATVPETVVLLHGQGRTRASMFVLRQRLRGSGYRTLSFAYNSRKSTIDQISDVLVETLRRDIETPTYHLLGHSLGNVIVRNGFKTGFPDGLARVVMLAPPNQPAQLARVLRDKRLFRLFTGDTGQKLGDESFYDTLPVPNVEFGIVAGSKSHTGFIRDEPNDGVVTADSTKLDGMTDWVLVHHTHTFMMNSRATFELVRAFLRTGKFRSG
jgi:triacylglycerol lipase